MLWRPKSDGLNHLNDLPGALISQVGVPGIGIPARVERRSGRLRFASKATCVAACGHVVEAFVVERKE